MASTNSIPWIDAKNKFNDHFQLFAQRATAAYEIERLAREPGQPITEFLAEFEKLCTISKGPKTKDNEIFWATELHRKLPEYLQTKVFLEQGMTYNDLKNKICIVAGTLDIIYKRKQDKIKNPSFPKTETHVAQSRVSTDAHKSHNKAQGGRFKAEADNHKFNDRRVTEVKTHYNQSNPRPDNNRERVQHKERQPDRRENNRDDRPQNQSNRNRDRNFPVTTMQRIQGEECLIKVPLIVDGIRLWAILDTGAACCILSNRVTNLHKLLFDPSEGVIEAFGGGLEPMLGERQCDIEILGKSIEAFEICIAKLDDCDFIIGLDLLEELGLIIDPKNKMIINPDNNLSFDYRAKMGQPNSPPIYSKWDLDYPLRELIRPKLKFDNKRSNKIIERVNGDNLIITRTFENEKFKRKNSGKNNERKSAKPEGQRSIWNKGTAQNKPDKKAEREQRESGDDSGMGLSGIAAAARTQTGGDPRELREFIPTKESGAVPKKRRDPLNKIKIRKPIYLFTVSSVKIPPYSRKVIKVASRDSTVDKKDTWLTQGMEEDKFGGVLKVANGLGEGPVSKVLIANFSSNDIQIPVNTNVSRAEIVDLDIDEKEKPRKKGIINSTGEYVINPKLENYDFFRMDDLIQNYGDIFGTSAMELGNFDKVHHEIPTGDNPPIRQRAYRLSTKDKNLVSAALDEMMEAGIIEKSSSPWSSPIILIPKKDSGVRIVVDYRKLNEVTKKDSYPLPRIDDIHETMGGHNWFSSVDFLSGYYQIPVANKDKEKTAFITHEGLYQFKVLPFGLCSAPATFQRTIDALLSNIKWEFCIPYIDDIFIFSKTFEDHLKHLDLFFQTIRESGLKLKPEKCKFGFNQIKALGHIINKDGISPDEEKVEAIAQMPHPRNVKECQAFLGAVGYYRKFIPSVTELEEPIRNLTREGIRYEFNDECVRSFNKLKEALAKAPVLVHFNPSKHLFVKTDASNVGVGIVLSQLDDEGDEHPIAFASKKLNVHEKRYSVTERECLGIMHAIKIFYTYLHSTTFSVITDHHALCYLKKLKNGDNKLARWALMLQQFGNSCDIIYKQGKKHSDADCFSRLVNDPFEIELNNLYLKDKREENILDPIDDPPLKGIAFCINKVYLDKDDSLYDRIVRQQQFDAYCQKMVRKVTDHPIDSEFVIENDALYKKHTSKNGELKYLIVVPIKFRKYILSDFHDSSLAGHLGATKTYARISQRFWWRNIKQNIVDYVKRCQLCQDRNTPKTKKQGYLDPSQPTYPWERVSIDILGPLVTTESGNTYVIAAQDHFTKFVEFTGIPNMTSETVANFVVYHIILRHGAPTCILSDRGKNFTANFIRDLYKLLDIKRALTSPYHPQTNGQVERLHATLADMVAKFTNLHHTDWDKFLPFLQFAYNSAVQDTTRFSPYKLNTGREITFPSDIEFEREKFKDQKDYLEKMTDVIEHTHQLVRDNISKRQEREIANYNKNKTEVKFQVGDLVSIKRVIPQPGKTQKFLSRWTKKGKIVAETSSGLAFVVQHSDDDQIRTYNVQNIKPYFLPTQELEEIDITQRQSQSQITSQVPVTTHIEPVVEHGDCNDDGEESEDEIAVLTPPNMNTRYPERTRREPAHFRDFVKH